MLDILKVEDVIFDSLIEHLNLEQIELDNYELDAENKTYYIEFNICLPEYISYESSQIFENDIANNLNYLMDDGKGYNIDLNLRWIVKH